MRGGGSILLIKRMQENKVRKDRAKISCCWFGQSVVVGTFPATFAINDATA